MAVREFWEIKWIQWINVQEGWVTQVSIADTVNIVWWWTVTDVWWVATINIPQWVTWYREDVTAGSATYTFINSPATTTSFLVFTDSWTLLFSGIDYTYDPATETITFLSLGANEAAYIWVAHALVMWWWIWDMVKAVYDPTNINSSAFDYNNFINTPNLATVATSWDYDDLSNKPSIPTVNNATLTIQKNGVDVNTFTANASSNVTANIIVPTKTSDLTNDSWFITTAWDVNWPVSSTDWNIVIFDWATGKLIKDSWLSIQTTNSIPAWANICDVYYNNGVIYIYTWAVRDNIILES